MKTRAKIIASILIAICLCDAIAFAQNDTIDTWFPYYYPCYKLQHSDVYDTTPLCQIITHAMGHNGLLHLSINTEFSRANVDNINVDNVRNTYVGFIAEREMDIIGISHVFGYPFSARANISERCFLTGGLPDTCVFISALGVAEGDSVRIVRNVIFDFNTVVRNRKLKSHRFLANDYEREYFYDDITEFIFDTPYHVNEGDTFYMSSGVIENQCAERDNITFTDNIYVGQEYHTVQDYPTNRYATLHFPVHPYRTKVNGVWQSGTFHTLQYLWAVVRFPEDTCLAPQGLRATPIADGTVLLQFDTMGNHAAWEVSCAPEGTMPEDGTRQSVSLPQAVVGNLNPEQHYMAYCRARCDFAHSEWSEWSEGVAFTPSLSAASPTTAAPTLSVSPNPATAKASVSCSSTLLTLTLHAADGTALLTLHPNTTSTTIDLTGLPRGLYTLLATTTAGTTTHKLIVD